MSLKNYQLICSASPEIIGRKFDHRQTEKYPDTIYGVCGFFLSVKFATSLTYRGNRDLRASINPYSNLKILIIICILNLYHLKL